MTLPGPAALRDATIAKPRDVWESWKQSGWGAAARAACSAIVIALAPEAGARPALLPWPGASANAPSALEDGFFGSASRATPVLLAQAGGETATDAPADAGKAAGGSGDAPTATGGTAWGIPPVRWGGTLATDLRASQTGHLPWRGEQNDVFNIRASSYIWQPWFAQVSGGAGIVLTKERWLESGRASAEGLRNSESMSPTGNGSITLFPVSRFPFNAYIDVSDSRASDELTTTHYTSTRFGMRQTYSPPESSDAYAASFNRSILESSQFGRDTVDALAASMRRVMGPQAFNVAGSHTRNTRSNTGERTAFSQLNVNHGYRPEPTLSVDTLASVSDSEFVLRSGQGTLSNRSRFTQANTFATWRPEEDSPLFVTGGGRLFRSAISSGLADIDALTLSGNVAATYALTPQTRMSGGMTVTQLMSDAANRLLSTQTVGVSHVSDPLALGGFTYAWNVSGNAVNQTGLAAGTTQNVAGRAGHNVSRNVILGEGSQLRFSLGQNVGATIDTERGTAQTLAHDGSVSWRLATRAATTAYLSALVTDTRTAGFDSYHFQMFNLQASGQIQLSGNSQAAANLTVQGTRQSSTPAAGPGGSASLQTTGNTVNVMGNVSYHNVRAFDVPRLRYTALLGFNENQFRSRLQGDVDAPRLQVNWSFEQRFDYLLGRVAMRLSMRVAEVEGRPDRLVFFRMVREFGAF